MPKTVAELWNLAEPYVKDAGFELVELDFTRDPGGQVLRVYIDYPWNPGPALPGHVIGAQHGTVNGDDSDLFPSRTVGLAECERVSRDLSAALDVADAIAQAYRLEVSSPGIDRPLRREGDFQRFAGAQVKLRSRDPVDGRRNFSGVLRGSVGGVVHLECDGQSYQVALDNVVKANLVPDWAAEFRKANRSAKEQVGNDERSAS